MEATPLERGGVPAGSPANVDPLGARLNVVDRDVLELVGWLRVITQTQIERLLDHVPGRTLRYRTRRLHELGLLGRSRPYRDRGSAPHHLWPTSRADAFVRGQPRPRRGERQPPSPLFLAHTAGISGLYVALATGGLDAGLELSEFRREGEAREAFAGAEGRSRAIAPDARIRLRGADGDVLDANVELDLGTMSHNRLRKKLDGYFRHVESTVREEGRPRAPVLLFVTTSPIRAEAICRSAESERARSGPGDAAGLRIAVCGLAERLDDVLTARCWRMVGDRGPRTLVELAHVPR